MICTKKECAFPYPHGEHNASTYSGQRIINYVRSLYRCRTEQELLELLAVEAYEAHMAKVKAVTTIQKLENAGTEETSSDIDREDTEQTREATESCCKLNEKVSGWHDTYCPTREKSKSRGQEILSVPTEEEDTATEKTEDGEGETRTVEYMEEDQREEFSPQTGRPIERKLVTPEELEEMKKKNDEMFERYREARREEVEKFLGLFRKD